MKKFVLAFVSIFSLFTVVNINNVVGQATDLIISEYFEGSSNNKYLEIYNGTGSDVNLSDYQLRLFSNGASSPTTTNTLSGTLTNGNVIVYSNSAATIYGGATTNASAVNFNGDDAIALYKISTGSYVDIFGNIGCDPGSAWTNVNTTVNKTLVRKSTVCSGIMTDDPTTCPFATIDSEWDEYNLDDTLHLGFHSMSCSPSPEIQTQIPSGTDVACGYTYDFSTQTTGSNTNVVLTIENLGTADLNITSYPLSGTNAGEFSLSPTSTGTTITAGNTYDVTVTFSPTTPGIKTAKITINSDDSDEGVCEINLTGTAYDACVAPVAQPTALDLTLGTTTTSIDGSFTASSPAADSYLIVSSTSSSLGATPVDGTTYLPGDPLGGGTIIDNISTTSFTAGSLTSGTEYYFFIFANNNVSCTGGPVYNTTSPLSNSEITIPNNVVWNSPDCIANSTIDLSWTAASGNSTGYLLVVREGAVPHSVNSLDPSTQSFNTDYSLAPQFGGTTPYSRVVYKGTGTSITISGLTQGLSYIFKLYTYTVGSADYVYASGTQSTQTISLDDVSSASATGGNSLASANWSNPSASCYDEILVVVNETAGIGFSPSGDGSAYTANTVYAAPDQVVYKSTGTNVTVTGLTNGTTYYFEIFVRKGTEWSNGVEVSVVPNPVTTLNQGDLAVLGLCSNTAACIGGTSAGDDEISFVCFQDITVNTTIDMTDNGWQRVNANLWGSSEGTVRAMRTGGTIVAGTVITFRLHVGGTYESISPDANWSFTELNVVGADLVMNSGGDQIYFMQDGAWIDGATTTSHDADYVGGVILFGFNSNSSWTDYINSTQQSGLIGGMDCFNMMPSGASDYLKYDGPMTPASQIEWVGRINDNSNWTSYTGCVNYYANGPDYTNGYSISITSSGLTATFQWYGNKDTQWFDCANWGPLRIPTASSDVVIPNSAQVDNDIVLNTGENAECNNFTVEDTIHTIKGENGATKILTINGNLTINGGTIDFDDGNNLTADGTIHLKGNWINNNATTDFLCGNSTVIFEGNTVQTITSNSTLENFGNVQITGSSVLDLNSNDIEVRGNWTNYGQAGLTEGTSTITFNGTANQNINTTGGEIIYNTVIDNSTTVTLLNNLTVSNQLNQVQGELVINGKTLTLQNDLIRISGTFTGSNSSNMIINGTGNLATDLFFTAGSQSLNNITINRASSGTVTLATNLTVYGILNMSSGELSMNDNILTLNGTISGTGTLKGSSNSELYIGGSGSLGTMYFSSGAQEVRNLTTNRSSGVSTLGTDLSVNNQLTLTNGNISTDTNILIVTNTATTSVAGHNLSSYINGNLRRYNLSTGSYDFPVGTASQYEFSNITLNSSTGITYFDATFTNPHTTPINIVSLGLTINGTPVVTLLDYGFWTIHPDTFTSVNYDVTLKSRGHTNGGTLASQHTIVKRQDDTYDWQVFEANHNNATQSGTGTNPITAVLTSMVDFSDFAIARSAEDPLPIELLSFYAKPVDSYVKLQWETASEINNDYFTVEKSKDGVNFYPVCLIQGAGNSTITLDYSAVDVHPYKGLSYYRLLQTDFDGRQSSSHIISVFFGNNQNGITYKIESNNFIVSSLAEENTTVAVFDISGKLLIQKDSQEATFKVSLFSLQDAGIYLFKIQTSKEIITGKFFK